MGGRGSERGGSSIGATNESLVSFSSSLPGVTPCSLCNDRDGASGGKDVDINTVEDP